MKKNGFFQGTLAKVSGYTLGTIINALVSFVSIPIMTALFPAEEMGRISLFSSYQTIALSFVFLGMDQSVSRYYYEPPQKMNSKSLTSICFGISLLACVIVSASICVLWKHFSYLILGEENFYIALGLAMAIFTHLTLRFLNQVSRLQNDVKMYVIQAVCITIASKLSYVLSAFRSKSAFEAIMIMVVFSFLVTAVFLGIKHKSTFEIPKKVSISIVKKILAFGLPQIPVQLLASLNGNISQIILKKFVNYSSVGIFSTTTTVTNAIAIVQNSINIIWGPYVYKNYKEKQEVIIKMHHIISFLMISAGLMLCLTEDIIYFILVDGGYWASKIYFPLMLISPICYTISETLGIGFKLAEKSYWNILVYGMCFVSNATLCYLLIPIMGMMGAAVANAISSIIMLLIKSIIGEYYYCCSDSYSKLIVAFLSMCIAVVCTSLYYESILRYIVICLSLIITMFIYRNEIIYIKNLVLRKDT